MERAYLDVVREQARAHEVAQQPGQRGQRAAQQRQLHGARHAHAERQRQHGQLPPVAPPQPRHAAVVDLRTPLRLLSTVARLSNDLRRTN